MRVFLVGDSIRMNAERHVCAQLPHALSLLSPSVNCESSRQVSEKIEEWAPADEGDIVHLNCGLHDIRRNPGTHWPVCTLEEYQYNLVSVFEFLSARRAKVIWATSTPFIEDVHNSIKPSRRFRKDLLDYNAASRALAEKYGFAVNELCGQLANSSLGELLLPDGLHFHDTGNKAVAEMIVSAINAVLARSNSLELTLRGEA